MPVDPLQLRIQTYPASVLRTPAAIVAAVTDEVRAVAAAMFDLMVTAEGIGLAAPQVGLSWRMFIIDIPPDTGRSKAQGGFADFSDGRRVYINPVLSEPKGGSEAYEEGCLSLPDIRGDVLRPPIITISAIDLSGNRFQTTGSGLLARCWQHEMDHLDGVLILDRMSPTQLLKNRRAIRDLEAGDE